MALTRGTQEGPLSLNPSSRVLLTREGDTVLIAGLVEEVCEPGRLCKSKNRAGGSFQSLRNMTKVFQISGKREISISQQRYPGIPSHRAVSKRAALPWLFPFNYFVFCLMLYCCFSRNGPTQSAWNSRLNIPGVSEPNTNKGIFWKMWGCKSQMPFCISPVRWYTLFSLLCSRTVDGSFYLSKQQIALRNIKNQATSHITRFSIVTCH